MLGNVKKRRGREPFEWRLQESFVNARGHQPIQLLYVIVYATVFVILCIFIYFCQGAAQSSTYHITDAAFLDALAFIKTMFKIQ